MRARSLIAILAIMGGLFVYALAAMLIAELLPAYWPVQTAFFAVAGIIWIVPAARFIRWSIGAKPPSPPFG
jgi:drug/metabolite transporter (DMT)-like permease